MCIGVSHDDLMVRFDPEMNDAVMAKKGAKPMEFTKRTMVGYAFIGPEGVKTNKELSYWVNLALEFNPKAQSSKKKKAAKKK
jgi:hypothetical protein